MNKLLIGLGLICLAVGLASASSANPISEPDDFTSAVSTSIDPAFFKYATEVNTDKTWDHSYQYIYSRRGSAAQSCCARAIPARLLAQIAAASALDTQ